MPHCETNAKKGMVINMKKMSPTLAVAVSAICAALSFVLMFLGSTTGLFDFSAAVIGGAVTVVVMREAGARFAAASVAVCTVLSALFIPDKTVFVLYLTAGGVYPIIKSRADRLRRLGSLIVKGISMGLILGIYLLSMRIFLPSELSEAATPYIIAASAAAIAVFIVYDIFLTKFALFYEYRLKNMLRR